MTSSRALFFLSILALWCVFLLPSICAINVADLEWENSQRFMPEQETTISFHAGITRKFLFYAYNPTKLDVELNFAISSNPTDIHKLHVPSGDCRPFPGLISKNYGTKLKVWVEQQPLLVAQLTYTFHTVIVIGEKNGKVMPVQEIMPVDAAFGPNIDWVPAETEVDFIRYYKTYNERSKRLLEQKPIPISNPIPHPHPHTPRQIPKIIHWVWLGKALPQTSAELMRSVFNHHREWDFHIWCDHQNPREELGSHFHAMLSHDLKQKITIHKLSEEEFPIMKTKFYKHTREVKLMVMCSDMIRISILKQHGGVYLDHDVGAVKSLDNLADKFGFFAPMMLVDTFPQINNDVLGSAKNHPCIVAIYNKLMEHALRPGIVEEMIKESKKSLAHLRIFVFYYTGPTLVQIHIDEHLSKESDMIVLPPSHLHGNYDEIRRFLSLKPFIHEKSPSGGNFVGIYPDTVTFTPLSGNWEG